MDIDRKRIAAVRALEALGFGYKGGEWVPPAAPEADAIHSALMKRADAFAGCTEGSDEEAELKTIVNAIEAYEKKHWLPGKECGSIRH